MQLARLRYQRGGGVNIDEQLTVGVKAGRTLIVGSHVYAGRTDRRLAYDDVVGVDMIPGDGVDRVLNMEDPLPADFGVFDHVECISVLEHSRQPWLLAANIERVLEPGGTLDLSVPFVWRVHGYPEDHWRFTVSGVRLLFPNIDWARLDFVVIGEGYELKVVSKVPVVSLPLGPYFARAEVHGFGVRA